MWCLSVSMTDNENSEFTAICGIRVLTNVYGDHIIYSRKLKAENDCGNQEDRFGLCYTQRSKTITGHLRRKFSCLFDSQRRAWMQGDWKAMALSPHSRRVEDFLLSRKLVAQTRNIIVWERKLSRICQFGQLKWLFISKTHLFHELEGIKLVRWFIIIRAWAWASMHCWSNVLSWHTNHG